MTAIVAHYLILNAVPLLCGMATGWIAGWLGDKLLLQLAWFLCAVGTILVVQYAGFVLVAALQTGMWPNQSSLDGLAYALAWFAIPASFTTVPLAGGAHLALALFSRQRRRSSRTPFTAPP